MIQRFSITKKAFIPMKNPLYYLVEDLSEKWFTDREHVAPTAEGILDDILQTQEKQYFVNTMNPHHVATLVYKLGKGGFKNQSTGKYFTVTDVRCIKPETVQIAGSINKIAYSELLRAIDRIIWELTHYSNDQLVDGIPFWGFYFFQYGESYYVCAYALVQTSLADEEYIKMKFPHFAKNFKDKELLLNYNV